MVRTRHAADLDDEEPDSFLTLGNRSRRTTRRLADDDESDESGVVQFNNEQRPVRRSAQRASAKRVSYVEDFIDDFPVRQTRRSRSRLEDEADDDDYQSKHEHEGGHTDMVSGEEEDFMSKPRTRRSRGRMNDDSPVRRGRVIRDDDDDDSPSPVRIQRPRRTSDFLVTHPSPRQAKQIKMEELEDMVEENGIRRSSRTRKFVYDSFHVNDMTGKDYDQPEQPKRKRQRTDPETVENGEEEEDQPFTDLYSRVKRKRKRVQRLMYGHTDESGAETDNEEEEEEEEGDDEQEEEEDNDENEEEEEEDDDDQPKPSRRSYYLRENKPRTNFYNVIPAEKRRAKNRFFNEEEDSRPPPRTHRRSAIYMSPARKRMGRKPRRRAFHGSSSTSSSSSGSSSDEEHFQKRKAKSMKKARQRLLPMNFDTKDLSSSAILRDRQKIGSSLADVDPMTVDKSITFESVGGLGKHVRALKEMVVFPLLYPEIFERFKISPPRGVLFYGPPGTGKTLVARALANECSKNDRRVAFYMRKGADCLSKWVGESERQLRLLFDQAYQTRPSIIFFDEIDGLAPVRSSRQDQIHSSIVSTLLALMDGLDSRGEIVVIGATNRIDSIDPALRRPGRFDREFLFPLPSLQARSQILKIHTKEWNPALSEKFMSEVAEKCVGYCGADMKALCTEAALLALRRRYPQIYTSTEKLLIDVSSIQIGSRDFYQGMQTIVPTSQRSSMSPARSLSTQIQPLLQSQLDRVLTVLNEIFPTVLSQLANLDDEESKKTNEEAEEMMDEDGNDLCIYEQKNKGRRKHSNIIPQSQGKFFDFIRYATRQPSTHRPRLMLSGIGDQGQSAHLAPAIIHHLEQLPVHVLDLPSLFAVSARSPEESCAQIFREARRTSPSIIYLPHINQWWHVIGETVKTTLLTLIQDLDPTSPLLLLATSEEEYMELDFSVQDLFDEFSGEVITMRNPNEEERQSYFKDLILNQTTIPPPVVKNKDTAIVEELPVAPPPEPRQLTEAELKKLHSHEEGTLTELRIFLRDVLNKLGRDRKFWIFTKPVDIEDVPDYYEIISNPMDLSTMMSKIDLHHYQTVKEFMVDINLICSNALEYNPDRDAQSRVIRHRACALRDTANAIIKAELDEEFEKVCQGIADSRNKRGVEATSTAPSYYHTRPLNQGPMHPLAITRKPTPTTSYYNNNPNVRTSRRLRGGEAGDGPSLEEVEKSARAMRSIKNSPKKENESTPQAQVKSQNTGSSGFASSQGSQSRTQDKCSKSNTGNSTGSKKKSVKKSIWGRSGYKKRRKWFKKRLIKGGEEGQNEDLADLEGNVDDDADDNDDDGDGSEEEMDVEDTDGRMNGVQNVQRSPRSDHHTENSGHDAVNSRSSRRNSVSNMLNIDVSVKSPRDSQKSPSQRSPRVETMRTPDKHPEDDHTYTQSPTSSPKLNKSDSCQKSPRQRNISGSRSPRSHDNLHSESSNKSLRRKSHDGDKITSPKTSDKVVRNIGASLPTNNAGAAAGVPAHVIMNGFDSGVGSSDMSGDSNDSAGKLISTTINKHTDEEKTQSQQKDSSTVNKDPPADVEMKDNEVNDPESPKLRVTRSMLHSKQTDSHNEPRPTVIVDKDSLSSLLNLTVKLTENYTVARLEKLYSILAQCIYQHRMDLNKEQLLWLMDRRLRQYTTSVSQRLLAEKNRLKV